MIHPLAEDFSQLKDAEIESRVSELSKKYWQSSNPALQNQISLFLDLYNQELKHRRAKAWQQQYQNRDKGLDKLINVK
jgi:hypothetical protein